jgi:hypothetical protein
VIVGRLLELIESDVTLGCGDFRLNTGKCESNESCDHGSDERERREILCELIHGEESLLVVLRRQPNIQLPHLRKMLFHEFFDAEWLFGLL